MERLVLWCRRAAPARDAALDQDPTAIVARIRASGAELVSCVGSSSIALFEPTDLEHAIETALTLVRDDRDADEDARIAVGLAAGLVTRDEQDRLRGQALDRAQMLAARARDHEVALDLECAERASDRYLWSTEVPAGLPGYVLDARFPRRRDCRLSLARLGAVPFTRSERETLAALQAQLATTAQSRLLLLRGSVSAGAGHLIQQLEREREPALSLHLRRIGRGLQPLGDLQGALRQRFRTPVFAPPDGTLDETVETTLRRLWNGDAVARSATLRALDELLAAYATRGAWIVLESLTELDSASLSVIAEALREGKAPALALGTLPSAAVLPGIFDGIERFEWKVGALPVDERRGVVESMLGPLDDPALAHQAAMLCGRKKLTVVEGVRTLVASGDLVHDGEVFGWRAGPPRTLPGPGLEAFIAERLSGLQPHALRMLEVICTVTPNAPRALLHRVATADGMSGVQCDSSLRTLSAEDLISSIEHPQPNSAAVPSVLRKMQPPSRVAELHRFAARGLEDEGAIQRKSFGQALYGSHVAEGGLDEEAARAWLDAARAATEAGFPRSALRLAAAAVHLERSEHTRKLAAMVARAVSRRRAGSAAPPGKGASGDNGQGALASRAARGAIEAILARDFDQVERAIDMAMAAGQGRGAITRLRAVAQLARGDTTRALRTLLEARDGIDPATFAREAVTLALVRLHSGDPNHALRASLAALAAARRDGDLRGEAAALCCLSACYRALGRDADARQIEQAIAS